MTTALFPLNLSDSPQWLLRCPRPSPSKKQKNKKTTDLLSNILMPNDIPCAAVKGELTFVFLVAPRRAALTPKLCQHRGKVYGIKANFLFFHRERGEAEEYRPRMFHIPTAPTAHSLCSLLLSLILNQSSFFPPYLTVSFPPSPSRRLTCLFSP